MVVGIVAGTYSSIYVAAPLTEWIDTKIASLLEHRSQWRSTMAIDDPGSAEQIGAFRGRILAELEAQGGLAGVTQGEAFKAITDV